MRLIDADALMPNAEYKGAYDLVSAYDIKNAPTIDPVQWVLCSDRLPSSEEQVIVTCHDTGGDTAFDYTSCGWVTRNGEYWIVENEINSYVVAWAPFPKPYKVKHE